MARPHSAIDRRALITGRLLNPDRVVAPPGGEIASILVQARPDRLDGRGSRDYDPGRMRDLWPRSQGQARRRGRCAGCRLARDHAQQLALLPDVYSASLVFHAIEATT